MQRFGNSSETNPGCAFLQSFGLRGQGFSIWDLGFNIFGSDYSSRLTESLPATKRKRTDAVWCQYWESMVHFARVPKKIASDVELRRSLSVCLGIPRKRELFSKLSIRV